MQTCSHIFTIITLILKFHTQSVDLQSKNELMTSFQAHNFYEEQFKIFTLKYFGQRATARLAKAA